MTIPARASKPASKRPARTPRHKLYGVIQVAWTQLGNDPGDLRDFLAEHYNGKTSRTELTWRELKSCIDRLKALGFKPSRQKPCRPLDEDLHNKILALWISGHHLGVIEDRSDGALDKFVRRMTKVDSVRWLNPSKAAKVAEELKKWLARAAGVQWDRTTEWHPMSVIRAQYRIIHGSEQADFGEFDRFLAGKVAALDGVRPSEVDALTLSKSVLHYADQIIAELGAEVRALSEEQRHD